ncbi:hypothetical protein LINPERPRIM_LOCUS14667 [Linum perenne]
MCGDVCVFVRVCEIRFMCDSCMICVLEVLVRCLVLCCELCCCDEM